MAITRRKRTDEEQKLYDQIETLKRQKSEQALVVTRLVDLMFDVKADEETDAVLGARARAALTARRTVDETAKQIESLQAQYEKLRARAAEDIPL